jgi:putative membrane protein
MLRYLSGGSFAPIARVSDEGRNSPLYLISIVLVFIGMFAFFAVLLNFL